MENLIDHMQCDALLTEKCSVFDNVSIWNLNCMQLQNWYGDHNK